MKTSILNLSTIFLFAILVSGCNTSKKEDSSAATDTCETELEELRKSLDKSFNFSNEIPEKFDFCKTEEAVLPNYFYTTITGIAWFSVPIPKGSNLKFIKKKNDTLFYECDGHQNVKYNDQDLIIENETVSRLPRKTGKELWVSVKFKNFTDYACDETNELLTEKVKTSEIQGDPIYGEKSD